MAIDVLRKYQQWDEREINRMIEERMANASPGIPIEDVLRETLARDDGARLSEHQTVCDT